eukprot:COSAG03_NODE_40008_length_101_cov_2464.000000_1_plen_33_part_11
MLPCASLQSAYESFFETLSQDLHMHQVSLSLSL